MSKSEARLARLELEQAIDHNRGLRIRRFLIRGPALVLFSAFMTMEAVNVGSLFMPLPKASQTSVPATKIELECTGKPAEIVTHDTTWQDIDNMVGPAGPWAPDGVKIYRHGIYTDHLNDYINALNGGNLPTRLPDGIHIRVPAYDSCRYVKAA